MTDTALFLVFVARVAANVLAAQAAPATNVPPGFEVASVKLNVSSSTQSRAGVSPDGSVTLINVPLRSVIAQAYGFAASIETSPRLATFKLIGGADDKLSARYDILAKAPPGSTRRDAELMLRRLLAERFRLRIRMERRETPVYMLIVAKQRTLGPNMTPSEHDCAAFVVAGKRMRDADAGTRAACGAPVNLKEIRSGIMTRIWAGPVAQLIREIQADVDRPVIDGTGLRGNFQWKVSFAIDPLKTPDIPSIYVAVEEQLGLKLQAASGPLDVFVIDSVESPTPD